MTRVNSIPVGILGATGPVGQRIAARLASHPYFELVALCASKSRANERYNDSIKDRLFVDPCSLEKFADMPLEEPQPRSGVKIMFSALAASAAAEIEPLFVSNGISVCSNASAFRMDDCVPIIMADVNPEHIELVRIQPERRGWRAPLVTNANCSTTGLISALAPLAKYGIKSVNATTYQALSGAGHPGPSAYSALGNVIPYIENEEHKIVIEAKKMLGKCINGVIEPASFTVDSACVRVPVANGHLVSVSVQLDAELTHEQIVNTWERYPAAQLPSAPKRPIVYLEAHDRPQPRLDLATGDGMTVSIGRLRRAESGAWQFFALVDNVVRGAAGAAILNGELLLSRGLIM